MGHLSLTAEYALRAMATLAQLPAGATISSRALAARSGVPQHYLSKVMRRCVEHGIAQGLKGPGGGFRLARPPERVRVFDIMAAVDESPKLNHCAFGKRKCSAAEPCALHPLVTVLNQQLWTWATTTTLAAVNEAVPQPTRRRPGKG